MPNFVIANANVKYVGVPYDGAFMELIGKPDEVASYDTMEEAINVAVQLKERSGDQTDWNVLNDFSERVVYTTKQEPEPVEENLTE